tara:strand:+ start:130 stop:354 length:225 start_codon:yes stop_codon:yes gene_type:complete
MSKEDDIMVAEGRAFDSKMEYLMYINGTLMDELEKLTLELIELQKMLDEQVVFNEKATQELNDLLASIRVIVNE